MKTLDAALHLARRFPGGIEALALRIPSSDPNKPAGSHKSAGALRHELTGSGNNKLGLEDAELISMYALEQRVDNPLAILNAFAANCRAVVVMLPEQGDGDDTTFAGLAAAAQEFSEFVASVAEAAADNSVSANELARVDKELGDLMGRAQSLRSRLAQIHEQGKPAAARGRLEAT